MPSLKTVDTAEVTTNNRTKGKNSKKSSIEKWDVSEGFAKGTAMEPSTTPTPLQQPTEISSTSPSPSKSKQMTPKKKDSKGQLTLGAFFAPRSSKSLKGKGSLKDKPKHKGKNMATAATADNKNKKKPLSSGNKNTNKKQPKKSASKKEISEQNEDTSLPETNVARTSTTSIAETGTKKVASKSSTRKSKGKSPDKEALLEIVLGPKVDDSKITSMNITTTEIDLPPSLLDGSSPLPLPRPGVRNVGLSKGKKRSRSAASFSTTNASNLIVTPSPKALASPVSTSNKKTKATIAEDTTATEKDGSSKNLLVNLEKTMEKTENDDTMDTGVDDSKALISTTNKDEKVEQTVDDVSNESIEVDDKVYTEVVDANKKEETDSTKRDEEVGQKQLLTPTEGVVENLKTHVGDTQKDSELNTGSTNEEETTIGSNLLNNKIMADSEDDQVDKSDDGQDQILIPDIAKTDKAGVVDLAIVEKGESATSKYQNTKEKSELDHDSKSKAIDSFFAFPTKEKRLPKENDKDSKNDLAEETTVAVDAPQEGERPKMIATEDIEITEEAKAIVQDKLDYILQQHVESIVEKSIPKENKFIINKCKGMRSRYSRRAEQLVKRGQDGLPEENFELPLPDPQKSKIGGSGSGAGPTCTTLMDVVEFPDAAVQSLAVIIQGSRLPLSGLASKAIKVLQQSSFSDRAFTTEAVSTKIKLLASRESYTGNAAPKSVSTDVFENVDGARNWRWELTSLDLLPQEYVGKVKKARYARRKLRSFWKAVTKLLSLLAEAERVLRTALKKEQRENLLARISSEENKVLKYEREEESNRLKEQAKLQKELLKKKEKEQKHKEKEEAEEKKRKEKAVRDAEKQNKKEEANRMKEETKKQKEEEKGREKKNREEKKRKNDEEAKKEELESEAKMRKQKAMMKSFFSTPAPKSLSNRAKSKSTAEPDKSIFFDTEKFRSMIDCKKEHTKTPLFPTLSKRAIVSRKRRTHLVTVPVFVTVMPDNPFTQQPYDEVKDIQVQNKYKFLAFHEDHRPPYHGTWSKPRSSSVTGKNPFGKDTAFLDYDYDSEAEWEEGDEDQGEDCDDAADEEEENVEDEEGDTRVYNYQDGWLAADDDLGQDDEIDDETKALRKKKLQASEQNDSAGIKNGFGITNELSTVCVIAPGIGGVPLIDCFLTDDDSLKSSFEGVAIMEAVELLESHECIVCEPTMEVYLDAAPPELFDETVSTSGSNTNGNSGSNGNKGKSSTTSLKMNKDDLRTFAVFVHHCTLPSKDKVVEEFRNAHKSITSSRAQATRKLDSIATKQKHPMGGVVWVVNEKILRDLGLDELAEKKLEQPSKAKSKTNKGNAGETEQKFEGEAKSPVPVGRDTERKTGGSSSKKKKRPAPELTKASAKLFASFLKKKLRTK